MKPVEGWVVIDPDGYAEDETFCRSSVNSISEFKRERDKSVAFTWENYLRRGYRCVRVTLRSD